MRSRAYGIVLLLCAWVLPLAAQSADPVFRSGVVLVEVPVLARDAAGNPVRNLGQGDFQVWIDGQPRNVEIFTAPVTPEAEAEARGQLPPGVHSNAPEWNRDSRGLIVLAVDSVNTCLPDQMQGKRQLAQFLRATPPRTRIALYSVGMQVRLLHDFTEDPELLIRRLQQMETATAETVAQAPVDQQAAPITTGRIDTFRQADRLEQQLRSWLDDQRTLGDQAMYATRLGNSFAAVEAILSRLAPLPGRKSLIWLSGGFQEFIGQPDLGQSLNSGTRANARMASLPKEVFDLRARFQAILRQATQAGVTIYPVDSRGLTPAGDIGPGVCDGIHASVILQNQQPLQEAAKVTGGRLIANTNDLNGSLSEIVRDIASTYTLGVYLPADLAPSAKRDKKGSRRAQDLAADGLPLRVETSREGVTLLHRSRIHVSEPVPFASQQGLEQVLRSPLDDTGLLFLSGLLPPTQPSGMRTIQVVIPVSQLNVQQEGARFRSTIRLGVLAKAPDGKVLHGEYTTLRATLDEAQMQQARQMGLIFRHAFNLPANTSTLRVAVREPQWGLTGSISIPISASVP